MGVELGSTHRRRKCEKAQLRHCAGAIRDPTQPYLTYNQCNMTDQHEGPVQMALSLPTFFTSLREKLKDGLLRICDDNRSVDKRHLVAHNAWLLMGTEEHVRLLIFQPRSLYVTRFLEIDKFGDDLLEKDISLSFDTIFSLFA